MNIWKSRRNVFGLVLFGALAAGVFVEVWGFMTAISLPTFLEPVRAAHPRVIVWWIDILYVGSVILTLLPAALFWAVVDGSRRNVSALLAVAPLLVLLLADFTHTALTLDLTPRFKLLLWDAALMVIGAGGLFATCDVMRRLTMRWASESLKDNQ